MNRFAGNTSRRQPVNSDKPLIGYRIENTDFRPTFLVFFSECNMRRMSNVIVQSIHVLNNHHQTDIEVAITDRPIDFLAQGSGRRENDVRYRIRKSLRIGNQCSASSITWIFQ